jgi:hypothetical protein
MACRVACRRLRGARRAQPGATGTHSPPPTGASDARTAAPPGAAVVVGGPRAPRPGGAIAPLPRAPPASSLVRLPHRAPVARSRPLSMRLLKPHSGCCTPTPCR